MSDTDHNDIILQELNGTDINQKHTDEPEETMETSNPSTNPSDSTLDTQPSDRNGRHKARRTSSLPPNFSDPLSTTDSCTPLLHHNPTFCYNCKKRLSRHSSPYPQEDVDGNGACRSCDNLISAPSLSDLLGEDVTDDGFQAEVVHKSQVLLIGRQEAELETLIDRLIVKKEDKERALLFVIEHFPTEAKVGVFVNTLLHRGANPSTCDSSWQTPLHHAVKRNFKGVCSKLLENDALPHARDRDNNMPYHIALRNNNDDIAAMLARVMPHKIVRDLYVARDEAGTKSECCLHDLIEKNMQQTALGVLDAMMDPLGDSGQVKVFYHVLEVDKCGRSPTHPDFQNRDKSCFQRISQHGLKSIVFHDVVRLLIRRKWKKYARLRFQLNSLVFFFTLLCLTFALVVATMTPDPAVYTGVLQVTRAVAEVISCGMVTFTLLLELNQMRKHRLDYWRDQFNWIDLFSSCLLLTVIPLRFTHTQGQWHVFSVGYLLWTLRMFKYAAVFRNTGAYALILWRIISRDFFQFVLFFLVILLAFAGAFVLALRGENSLHVHQETSSYWNILFVGVRTLIEAYAVVDYAGANGYPPLSCFLMVVFLFVCCVVLLSILIAQLSDTYHHVQRDAQRGLELNRAWIITRVELNSIYIGKGSRLKTYVEQEVINNPRTLLQRWEGPELTQMNKNIRELWDQLDSNRMTLLTIQARMSRQENTLIRIQEYLERALQTDK